MPAELAKLVGPASGVGGLARNLGKDALEQQLLELVLVADVRVQRSGPGVELDGDPPHAHAVHADLVEQPVGDVDDQLAAELTTPGLPPRRFGK
nr:hypothetical protein [Kutzneria chonburiensis]